MNAVGVSGRMTGKRFNNPTPAQPAIFWPGYTGRGTVLPVAPLNDLSK
jgi:hypothetical protein